MNKLTWLSRAGNLHQACAYQMRNNNGGGRLSGLQANQLNALQHAIGSRHGVRRVTFREARESLDEMFTMVKAGQKDDLLT